MFIVSWNGSSVQIQHYNTYGNNLYLVYVQGRALRGREVQSTHGRPQQHKVTVVLRVNSKSNCEKKKLNTKTWPGIHIS
jgi:hypothetical protein